LRARCFGGRTGRRLNVARLWPRRVGRPVILASRRLNISWLRARLLSWALHWTRRRRVILLWRRKVALHPRLHLGWLHLGWLSLGWLSLAWLHLGWLHLGRWRVILLSRPCVRCRRRSLASRPANVSWGWRLPDQWPGGRRLSAPQLLHLPGIERAPRIRSQRLLPLREWHWRRRRSSFGHHRAVLNRGGRLHHSSGRRGFTKYTLAAGRHRRIIRHLSGLNSSRIHAHGHTLH
jgi:hypothetical protein